MQRIYNDSVPVFIKKKKKVNAKEVEDELYIITWRRRRKYSPTGKPFPKLFPRFIPAMKEMPLEKGLVLPGLKRTPFNHDC